MSHQQALRIPFQEFGFFTQLSQESSPKISSHTHILEENLLISCDSQKKSLPLRDIYSDSIFFTYNNMEVQTKENKIFAPLKDK
jgi:hypothetical protein